VAIKRNEKVQAKTLPFVNEETSPERSEKLNQDAKDVQIKLKNIYKRKSEVIPLHYKSKYETIVLKDEDEKETADISYLTDRKTNSFASIQNSQPSLNIRDSYQATPIPMDGTRSSFGEIYTTSTPSNHQKERFSTLLVNTPSRSKFPITSIEGFDGKSSPRTPSSLSLSPQLKFPKIHSPKSSFSTLVQEKKSDNSFTSIVNRLKTNTSYLSKLKDPEDPSPTNYFNVCSPKYEYSQIKNFDSIFESAVKVIAGRKSSEHKQDNLEENHVKNIHIQEKIALKPLESFLKKSKKGKKSAIIKKTKPSIAEKRNSEQGIHSQKLNLIKKSNSFFNTLTIQKKNTRSTGC